MKHHVLPSSLNLHNGQNGLR